MDLEILPNAFETHVWTQSLERTTTRVLLGLCEERARRQL